MRGTGLAESYITRVQNGSILPANLWEHVAFVTEKTVHIPDETEILLVATCVADREPPFFYRFEDLCLDAGRSNRGPLRESADELVEKFFGANLQVEGIAAVFHADIQQTESEQGDIGIPVVDEADNGGGSLARGCALLAVDEIGDLEVQGEVRLVVLGAAGGLDEAL